MFFKKIFSTLLSFTHCHCSCWPLSLCPLPGLWAQSSDKGWPPFRPPGAPSTPAETRPQMSGTRVGSSLFCLLGDSPPSPWASRCKIRTDPSSGDEGVNSWVSVPLGSAPTDFCCLSQLLIMCENICKEDRSSNSVSRGLACPERWLWWGRRWVLGWLSVSKCSGHHPALHSLTCEWGPAPHPVPTPTCGLSKTFINSLSPSAGQSANTSWASDVLALC